MKNSSTVFLKSVVTLIGAGVISLISLITFVIIKSGGILFLPILIIMYLTALPFFIALYQGIKLLNYIDKNAAFSQLSIKALGNIKRCAIAISILYIAGMPLIFYVGDQDDAPGIVAFGLIFIFISIVIATFAAVLQRLLQSGLDIKSENDLTI